MVDRPYAKYGKMVKQQVSLVDVPVVDDPLSQVLKHFPFFPIIIDVKMKKKCRPQVYVVVQFYPWFKFYFPLLLGMVMYDNEFQTKENKI